MGFLERIVGEKREEVERKRRRRPATTMIDEMESTPVRDFRAAIAGGDGGHRPIIAELKARTPSIDGFAWSDRLGDLAAVYRDGGAAAISVVTDEHNFGTMLQRAVGLRPLKLNVDFLLHGAAGWCGGYHAGWSIRRPPPPMRNT